MKKVGNGEKKNTRICGLRKGKQRNSSNEQICVNKGVNRQKTREIVYVSLAWACTLCSGTKIFKIICEFSPFPMTEWSDFGSTSVHTISRSRFVVS